MASGVFGLRKVYKKQVENVTNNNFASWPEGATYGYFGGGSLYDIVDRIDFSNDTTSVPGNNLPQARSLLATVSSDSYGYFGGGFEPPTIVATVDRIDFSNETFSSPGNNLPQARRNLAGTSSNSYGYFGGGLSAPTTRVATIERIDFSNETINFDPSRNLTEARSGLKAVSSDSYGYFGGGFNPTNYVDTVDRIDLSNETTSAPGNDLTALRNASGATSNNSYGYFGGGNLPTVASIDRIDFSNEVVSVITNSLSQARFSLAAVSGGASILRGNGYRTYGYWAGGGTSVILPYNIQSSIARQDFSTSSISVISSNLLSSSAPAAGKQDLAAMSSNNYGYFVGGDGTTPPTVNNYTSDATRIDFSNETTRRYPAFYNGVFQINGGVKESSGAQSSHYGYIAGGYGKNPINTANAQKGVLRMDFETETTTGPSNLQLTTRMSNGAAVQSSDEAYFGGGFSPPPSSAITDEIRKFVFANETRSISPMVLSSTRYSFAGASNNNYGYFGGGAPGDRSQADRVDFSTETLSPNQAFIAPAKKTSHSATSDGFYAYFGGGADNSSIGCKIFRFDYSTETHTTYTDLPTIRTPRPGTVSN
jgi:hypothetical protein